MTCPVLSVHTSTPGTHTPGAVRTRPAHSVHKLSLETHPAHPRVQVPGTPLVRPHVRMDPLLQHLNFLLQLSATQNIGRIRNLLKKSEKHPVQCKAILQLSTTHKIITNTSENCHIWDIEYKNDFPITALNQCMCSHVRFYWFSYNLWKLNREFQDELL